MEKKGACSVSAGAGARTQDLPCAGESPKLHVTLVV